MYGKNNVGVSMKPNLKILSIIIILVYLFSINVLANDKVKIINLEGKWRFSIGDNPDWAKPGYNDSQWEKIYVPDSWENQGFNGYNGYAWYRISFNLPREYDGRTLYLSLGRVDDVDETFINGKMIGRSGSFPPNYQTSYYAWRNYPIPAEILNRDGSNEIAVRVYDSQLEGGIVEGDIGIFTFVNALVPDISFEGKWKFKTGDNEEWEAKDFNDKDWDSIIVPGYWESQGYKNYDGIAWYRKEFTMPQSLLGKQLVLLMGKIDDYDEVYLNGQLVGSTGDMKKAGSRFDYGKEYAQFRGYYILDNKLLIPGKNVIAVRVYDGYNIGGIYEGPIGLITQNEYIRYWKSYKSKDKKNFWDYFFDN